MGRMVIPLHETDVPAVCERLVREIERLEMAGKRKVEIRYPSRFADELEIAIVGERGLYRGHPASVHDVVPYEVVIEYED
jgi:hypothetical protein